MSSSPSDVEGIAATSQPKRTRKRLRVSCVECTRRRQKCDRNQPCGLCVSRGVSHLCRWEAVPFARPAPKRPPPSASPSTDQLLAKIAVLEEKLANMQHAPKSSSEGTEVEGTRRATSSTRSTPESTNALSVSDSSDVPMPAGSSNLLNPVGFWGSSESESFLVSAVLAQDSLLGHHGEYIGRDSAIRSLHMLSSPQEIPFHYTKSTDAISLYKHPTGELMPPPLPSTLEYLVPNIPPRPVVDMLCQTFFAKANWRYGIPEEWFYTAYDQMWTVLSLPQGCGIQVNPHWLSLLFAICAITPKSVKEMSHLDDKNNLRGEAFFSSAMVARRIAEDTYLSSPVFAPLESAADGTVLSCFAAPILAYFLAERNRVSEAWKLVGNSIRSAQSVGLHRDPGWEQWHTMSENERLLRSRAWWALYQWDLLYSFTLSRPSMLQVTCFDVPLPCANPQAPVKAQLFSDLQSQFVQIARILDKAIHKCFGLRTPSSDDVFMVEEELQQWRSKWPPYLDGAPYRLADGGENATAIQYTIRRQRFSLQTWYLACRMKLHRSFLTQKGHPRQPDVISKTTWLHRSRALSLEIALEMVSHQCHAFTPSKLNRVQKPDDVAASGTWCFEGVFFLYDAAVTIIVAMMLHEPQSRRKDAEAAFESAVAQLKAAESDMVGRRSEALNLALQSLLALGREENWRCNDI